MFKIREIVVDGSVEVTNRYLSLEFKDRGQAISYIEELQARYFHNGRDEEQDYWWARNDGAIPVYRWTIEGVPIDRELKI